MRECNLKQLTFEKMIVLWHQRHSEPIQMSEENLQMRTTTENEHNTNGTQSTLDTAADVFLSSLKVLSSKKKV